MVRIPTPDFKNFEMNGGLPKSVANAMVEEEFAKWLSANTRHKQYVKDPIAQAIGPRLND